MSTVTPASAPARADRPLPAWTRYVAAAIIGAACVVGPASVASVAHDVYVRDTAPAPLPAVHTLPDWVAPSPCPPGRVLMDTEQVGLPASSGVESDGLSCEQVAQ